MILYRSIIPNYYHLVLVVGGESGKLSDFRVRPPAFTTQLVSQNEPVQQLTLKDPFYFPLRFGPS